MNQQNKREHWANILEQQQQSGLSIKQFCINNISYQTFYYWSKKLNQSEPETQVQPILVTDLVESCASCVVLTFNNGVRAELPTCVSLLMDSRLSLLKHLRWIHSVSLGLSSATEPEIN